MDRSCWDATCDLASAFIGFNTIGFLGYSEAKVYIMRVSDLYSLKRRIVQMCEEITDARCQLATRFLIDRDNACFWAESHHFEQNI